MNQLMKSALERLVKSVTMQSEDEQRACVIDALNDISVSICSAIFPTNDLMVPFVSAVFSQYNDMLNERMDASQKLACESAKEITKNHGRKTEIKFPRKEQ